MRSPLIFTLFASLLMVAAPGCAQLSVESEAAVSHPETGLVHHMVFVWLKEDQRSEEAVAALIEAQEALRTIPGLVSLEMSRAIPSERPMVDDSFDLVSHFTFESVEAMGAYLSHPTHIAFLRGPSQAPVDHVVIYDFQ